MKNKIERVVRRVNYWEEAIHVGQQISRLGGRNLPQSRLKYHLGTRGVCQNPTLVIPLRVLKSRVCLKLDPCAADRCFLTTVFLLLKQWSFWEAKALMLLCSWGTSAEGGWEVAEDVPSPFSVLLTSSGPWPLHSLEQSLGSGVPWKKLLLLFPAFLCHHFKKMLAFWLTQEFALLT